MKRIVILSLAGAVCLTLLAANRVFAQGKMTTDVAITGHTYEPAKIEPTDERVSGLKVPDGFRVSKKIN
ncbi:MAG TPA: hypothetical protein VM866_00420 [Pyrinomonadaceae bacterium]|jgi:hypothetical protein|nr:hypothetical protein [Pyrinomonadaceae bacterium]